MGSKRKRTRFPSEKPTPRPGDQIPTDEPTSNRRRTSAPKPEHQSKQVKAPPAQLARYLTPQALAMSTDHDPAPARTDRPTYPGANGTAGTTASIQATTKVNGRQHHHRKTNRRDCRNSRGHDRDRSRLANRPCQKNGENSGTLAGEGAPGYVLARDKGR